MFLRSLKIQNDHRVIREITFHAGLNLIVDETPEGELSSTGNNVGKTTVLKLIDVCLGADPKRVYTDLENPKVEYGEIKRFLFDTNVVVTLALCESLTNASDRDLVIERNFLPRKKMIRRINGQSMTEEGFESYLTEHLFPGHFGQKPTFPQITSHNVRYREPAVSNTLRTLHDYTRDDEYEALYLFLLGCNFVHGNEKQELLTRLRIELAFKARLESKQTRSAYEISLRLLLDDIRDLEVKRSRFTESSDLDAKIAALGTVKYRKNVVAAEAARVRLRRELVKDAAQQMDTRRSGVDVPELEALYAAVSEQLGPLVKSFDKLVVFHNRMIDEKIRYIAKDLPRLEHELADKESELRSLAATEAMYVKEISQSGVVGELENIVAALNDRHRLRGEYETVIDQISAVDFSIYDVRNRLNELDAMLFSDASWAKIQEQLAKFNRHFSAVSDELYGEKYALKVDRSKNRSGQQIFKFSCFNTNFSSGKKQGEITCFDIAYALFADEEGIPCYHFLLNDKKELMHDHQLERIGNLVERQSDHVQFVASILRDKLPEALNKEEYIVVKLSQDDKLLRVETHGADPDEVVSGGEGNGQYP
ncbi:DUF2326 domain-containing protein [Stenotrophomonas sp. SORGH_AS_0321]|uniref:DUF2326 domain-containing protein n=1 Tax=Stenotrophomonas sp. SORGH_AS_0321 TaxID=3041787 RepID=UPI00285936B4|nr:DUF2326 domain-containing protein [Stenotrophomonas sp. SORGH_AS_0321]MDR6094026.1 uncharacterized protein YydD (DUF2326 family) [Stenotrophomonas sp. SORGH_AS_0321]